jgi:hypothetical protein
VRVVSREGSGYPVLIEKLNNMGFETDCYCGMLIKNSWQKALKGMPTLIIQKV